MRQYRRCLRPIGRRTYARFAQEKVNGPKKLETLLEAAGMPPNVPIRKGAQIRSWYENNREQFSEDQKQLWEFAVAIYPEIESGAADPMEKSIIAAEEKTAFDEARRHLATFFHRQWEATSNRGLFAIVPHTKEDVILLSWLELALARSTKDAGPPQEGYGGKRGLFEYGQYLQKRHDRKRGAQR